MVNINKISFAIFIGFIGFATLFILKPFLAPILWGCILAICFAPIVEMLVKKFKLSTGGAALGVVGGAAIAIVGPLTYIGLEIANVYVFLKKFISGLSFDFKNPPAFLNKIPMSEMLIDWWKKMGFETSSKIYEIIDGIDKSYLLLIPKLGGQLSGFVMSVICALTALYYILKNKEIVEKKTGIVVHKLFSSNKILMLENGLKALRGTVNGIVVVGIIEGALLAIPLIAGGVPGGLLIAFGAGILGVIPLVMPILIMPCIVYLYLTGTIFWSVITALLLVIVWVVFENIYKPKLISDSVRVHPLIVLISLLGGLQAMGVLGLFIGPAIVSMAIGFVKAVTDSEA